MAALHGRATTFHFPRCMTCVLNSLTTCLAADFMSYLIHFFYFFFYLFVFVQFSCQKPRPSPRPSMCRPHRFRTELVRLQAT